jgi:hypothetical protein
MNRFDEYENHNYIAYSEKVNSLVRLREHDFTEGSFRWDRYSENKYRKIEPPKKTKPPKNKKVGMHYEPR